MMLGMCSWTKPTRISYELGVRSYELGESGCEHEGAKVTQRFNSYLDFFAAMPIQAS
jgi:hypothetical protein